MISSFLNILFDFLKARLIFMLVDAMRYDFIFEQVSEQQDHDTNNEQKASKHIRMPFVNRLLRESKAKAFKLKASPPTVTLPRIKVNFLKFAHCFMLKLRLYSVNI